MPAKKSEIETRVLSKIDECRRAWEEFSPEGDIFSDWEYRACFFDPNACELHFILGVDKGESVFLIPLWKSHRDGYYEWFGGQVPEGNQLFAKSEKYLPALVKAVPENSWLTFIDSRFRDYFEPDDEDQSFFISLREIGYSVDKYLAGFGKKHRKNFLRDFRMLQEKGALVEKNRLEDFGMLVDWNQKRFPGESFFAEEGFVHGMRRLVELAARRGELEMLSIILDGKAVASEIAVLHNKVYTVLFGGSAAGVHNVGKMLSFEHIKNACEKKADVIDFLSNDCGWKSLWNMSEKTLLEYDI